jgi:pyrimidine operon attenuation protein/uracil phosphoribosyltransferase
VLLDAPGIERTIRRMAAQVVELVGGTERLAIVGIHTGGVYLAERLSAAIEQGFGARPAEGMIDITLYRDDTFIGLPQPVVGRTELPFEITGARILLVDDVLFTGRTVRSALDAIVDYGRPKSIHLAVLCDRVGLRELPIQADSVGLAVTTTRDHTVQVELREDGSPEDRVCLYEAPPRRGR